MPSLSLSKLFAATGSLQSGSSAGKNQPQDRPNPLNPPALGTIPVAFPISRGAVIIDFCGPWEVFDAVDLPNQEDVFHNYTVAETLEPIIASGGMKIIPNYTFETAPPPKVVVIPAQRGSTEPMLEWIRTVTKATDVTMSVCTGAFVLAKTGLLSGKSATTFHEAFADFEKQFPDIHLKRGARFVEDGNLASSGGLTSGMDLAFRVVERYYGSQAAERTAYLLEYQGKGWQDPNSNEVYARKISATADAHPLCPLCSMSADLQISSVYKGKTYYFCMEEHKQIFDANPGKFAS
jgi:transcriptional regulator GlxA family with amidase domain/YHS domain-containing protein